MAPAPTRTTGSTGPLSEAAFAVRRIPYPYRALLALCSDLDETPDLEVYRETARFLNTDRPTTMGPGVGLEVGNSIYFDMPPDQFAYWNTDDRGREVVRALIRSGHIDCIHSFGDLAVSRSHAGRALDDLARHGLSLAVWIDHATAPSNFGADIMQGRGDVRDSEVYHADLTCGFGVRYVWRGRVTSVVGQDVPRRLSGIFAARHPLASARTLAKEAAKGLLARRGSAKYALHARNTVLEPVSLRDGRPVLEFLRSNPSWEGVEKRETAVGLPDVLVPGMIERLIAREGVSVLYTHLGKVHDRREPLGERARAALRHLAVRQERGDVLVTTTRRLLDLCQAAREARLTVSQEGGATAIDVRLPSLDLGAVPGLTVHVPDPARVTVAVNGQPVGDLRRNPADHHGRPSVSVPWRRLQFPDV
jgi:hypothetical protein